MSEMAITARALQGTGGNNDWRDKSSGVSWKYIQWRRRRDVLQQSVPLPQSVIGDQKSLIADCWRTGASDNERWWQSRVETLTGHDSIQTAGGIPQRGMVKPSNVVICIYQNSQLEPGPWQWQPKVAQIRVHNNNTNQTLNLILT